MRNGRVRVLEQLKTQRQKWGGIGRAALEGVSPHSRGGLLMAFVGAVGKAKVGLWQTLKRQRDRMKPRLGGVS